MTISADKVQIVIIIDKSTQEKLDKLAKQERRSRSSQAALIIEQNIDKYLGENK